MPHERLEPVQGPPEQWQPSDEEAQLIERLLASSDELDRAYGEAYRNSCFVCEFAEGLTAVGELVVLKEIQLRGGLEEELEPHDLSLGDCVNFTYPGRGESRAERVLDGLRQVLEERARPASQ